MKSGKQGILPTREKIRMTKRNSDFPYLAPVAIPRELPNGLPQTHWQPAKDRAFRVMMEKINPDRTYFNGKK